MLMDALNCTVMFAEGDMLSALVDGVWLNIDIEQ